MGPPTTINKEKTKPVKSTVKIQPNRQSLKRNKRVKNYRHDSFVLLGNNCNTISNKLQSFNKVLPDLTPAIFFLQETKRKISDPPIKTKNTSSYQIFELRREKDKKDGGKGLEGGGLAIRAMH